LTVSSLTLKKSESFVRPVERFFEWSASAEWNFGFAEARSRSSVASVKWFKTVVTILVVAVWLPASSHALLQHVGFIHQVHAHDGHADDSHEADSPESHEHDADNHDAADGLCVLSVGKVQVPSPAVLGQPCWFALPLIAPLREVHPDAFHSGLSPPGVAPPELSHRWQFSFRAALPVRAPSFIS
jgi:hypothetical protein